MKVQRRALGAGLSTALLAPSSGVAAAVGEGLDALVQGTGSIPPLPAEPPIGGPVWTVVIPAVLFLGSFLGTFLLYKRFSGEEGE